MALSNPGGPLPPRPSHLPGGLDPASVRFGPDGLVAAVVQDARDGRVLMVAWQDAEAIEATLRTGEAHFHSRSRGRLWRKGESSGNTLSVVFMELDCDADAILVGALPAGPTCHRGTRSCFDAAAPSVGAADASDAVSPPLIDGAGESLHSGGPGQGFAWLERLWATIAERAWSRPEGSYTASLVGQGVDAVGRKVVEEATEVLVAAKDDAVAQRAGIDRPRAELAGELADLLYHALVLCAERGLPPSEIIDVLRSRQRA